MRIFSEKSRNATVYFAWREGQQIIPEAFQKAQKSFNRLFLETQILFVIVFIIFGMVIFVGIATVMPDSFCVAPLILIAIQFGFVFFSSRFIARTADWHITAANPTIHLLEFYLPFGEKKQFQRKILSRNAFSD
jgi:heat shock protein HtpX